MSRMNWASSAKPSLPVAPSDERLVKMGGFAFTQWGIAPDLSSTEVEMMSIPDFFPMQVPTNG